MKLTNDEIIDLQSLLVEDLTKSKDRMHRMNRLENFDNGYLCGLLTATVLNFVTSEHLLEERSTASQITLKLLHFNRQIHLMAHYLMTGENESCPEVDDNISEISRLLARNIIETLQKQMLRATGPASPLVN